MQHNHHKSYIFVYPPNSASRIQQCKLYSSFCLCNLRWYKQTSLLIWRWKNTSVKDTDLHILPYSRLQGCAWLSSPSPRHQPHRPHSRWQWPEEGVGSLSALGGGGRTGAEACCMLGRTRDGLTLRRTFRDSSWNFMIMRIKWSIKLKQMIKEKSWHLNLLKIS